MDIYNAKGRLLGHVQFGFAVFALQCDLGLFVTNNYIWVPKVWDISYVPPNIKRVLIPDFVYCVSEEVFYYTYDETPAYEFLDFGNTVRMISHDVGLVEEDTENWFQNCYLDGDNALVDCPQWFWGECEDD